MNSKQFFKQLGMLLYGIDGIYDEYGRKNKIASTNVLWVLYALNDDEKHSQKDICDGWSIPRTTINTIIKDLEQQQMVEMIPIFGKRRKKIRIPDVIVYINGLPLIVIELKSFDEDVINATLEHSYAQLGSNSKHDGYRYDIPTLFNYNVEADV